MTKIAMYHNLPAGGSKRMLYDLVRLLKGSYDIHVFEPCTADQDFYDLEKAGACCSRYRFKPLLYGRFSNPYVFTPVFLLDQFRLKAFWKRMARDINEGGYERVIIHHDRYTQNPLLTKYLSGHSVLYCQEPYRFFYEPQYDITRTLPLRERCGLRLMRPFHDMLRRLDREAVKHAGHVLANSAYTREYIYKAYQRWSTVTYLGLDTAGYPLVRSKPQQYVMSVGAINWRKSHDLVIRAVGEIPPERRPSVLIVAPSGGNERERRFLERTALQRGVQCEYGIAISHETLCQRYSNATAVVCASIMEPFGLVPLEAMACGTPVVAVREAGYRETVIDGETGFLVERNERAIADCVSRLLDNSDLRDTIINAAGCYVRSFWDWRVRLPALERNMFRDGAS